MPARLTGAPGAVQKVLRGHLKASPAVRALNCELRFPGFIFPHYNEIRADRLQALVKFFSRQPHRSCAYPAAVSCEQIAGHRRPFATALPASACDGRKAVHILPEDFDLRIHFIEEFYKFFLASGPLCAELVIYTEPAPGMRDQVIRCCLPFIIMNAATASNRFPRCFVWGQDLDIGIQRRDLCRELFRRFFAVFRLCGAVAVAGLQQNMGRCLPSIVANLTPASDRLVCIEIRRFNQDIRSNFRKFSGKLLVRLAYPLCAFGTSAAALIPVATQQHLRCRVPCMSADAALTFDRDFTALIF